MTNDTKQATHTPGPWIIDDGGIGKGRLCLCGDEVFWGDSQVFIRAWPADEGFDICTILSEEIPVFQAKANARLIAAAPEMLEALELALPFLMQFSGYQSGGLREERVWHPSGPVIEAVNAAIRKAVPHD